MSEISKNPRDSSGQAMVLTVVMLGGLMLSATAIAGLLMFYQLRQTNDAVSSGQAVFAADAGLEAGLYCYFYTPIVPPPDPAKPDAAYCSQSSSDFSNNANYQSSLKFTFNGSQITGFTQDSYGFSSRTERVLRNVFSTQL